MAIAGDVLVVGAYLKDEQINATTKFDNAGSAYIFRKQTDGSWKQEQKLQPDSLVDNARFGRSVALYDESTIAVGAYLDDHAGDYSGSAYIFRRNDVSGQWEEEQKLVADDASTDSLFGFSIAIHDNIVFVGARNENNQSGSVYVFTREDDVWKQVQKLVPYSSAPGELFGTSISIDDKGKTIVVGAQLGDSTGSAHVFTQLMDERWVELNQLVPIDDDSKASFGRSVALTNEFVAVGATNADDVGSVYMFQARSSGWTEQQQIRLADSSTPNSKFGRSLAMSMDQLAIASRYGQNGESASIHLYERGNDDVWQEQFNITEFSPESDFRRAILAMDGGSLVVGSTYGSTSVGNRTGAVYVYEI